MLSYVMAQIKRRPVPAMAVLLFAAILSTVISGLYAARDKAQENYEEFYRTVPVTVTATDLKGDQWDDLTARRWIYNVFTTQFELGDYLKDVQVKAKVYNFDINSVEINGEPASVDSLIGVTGLTIDTKLLNAGENAVNWLDGYDSSVLQSDEPVCIVPEKYFSEESGIAIFSFASKSYRNGAVVDVRKDERTLQVVGTHSVDSSTVYCPFSVVKQIYDKLEKVDISINAISGTMIDNHKIDEMWEVAEDWFVRPNPTGQKTPWGKNGYVYYPFALKVDDSQLKAAAETLQNSLAINEICTTLTFALSAVAGFLIGFLMIRSRKREIALMRTMGTPKLRIYGGFALEQLLCAVLGAVLGGAYFLWQPVERLAAFVGIYFVGLSIALLIFLNTKLITTIKEDE